MLLAWLVEPLALGALAFGCGFALEWAAGVRLPGALLAPAGLAVVIVVAGLATMTDATAELAAPTVVIVAAVGYVRSYPRIRWADIDWWAAAAAAVVFVVFAAPVVLSGAATFAGYIKLDDTATWLAMTDRVMEHGRSMAGLAPSSYEATLDNYLRTGYPVGSFLPLGIGHELVRQDSAWLFQPTLTVYATLLALCLYSLLGRVVASGPWRALGAAVAAQPALLLGYTLWGGIKEIAAAWLIALVAALAPLAAARAAPVRTVLPLAVASAATLGALSLGGAIWLAPVLAVTAVAAMRAAGASQALLRAAVFAAAGALLALPSAVLAADFLAPLKSGGGGGVFTGQAEVGNLLGPLKRLQFFGVWPAADFRVEPSALTVTHVLIALVVAAGLAGLAFAVARGAWELVLYIVATTIACFGIVAAASPWVDAKTLALASPAFLLAAMTAAAGTWERGRRAAAAVVAIAIAGGVLWSNVLAYHGVSLAPRDQLAELEHIGRMAAGEGPALMTEYEPYGARHFLRLADGEGASELRRRLTPLLNGQQLQKGLSGDLDDFGLPGVLAYRSLILRLSPVASRPPASYTLVWRGETYELWQRPIDAPAATAHLPLGDALAAGAVPRCRDVARLAQKAGPLGRLATVARTAPVVVGLGTQRHPADWAEDPRNSSILYPKGSGTMAFELITPAAARYGVWLGGSSRGRVSVRIDGRAVGSASATLNHAGTYMDLGHVRLAAGRHSGQLRYDRSALRPGVGGQDVQGFPFGPLVLGSDSSSAPVEYTAPREYRKLCGRRLDWIETYSTGR